MSLWRAEQFQPVVNQISKPLDALDWFDRYPKLPIILLFLLPFILTIPLAIFGLSIDPIWQQSGIATGVTSGLLPGFSYNDPNFGFTTQALGRLAAQDWLHGKVPWWNPYSGIGLPLAGAMQNNAMFLPFVFWLLLPNGVLWLKISMEILAGVATYALIRELGLGRLAALTGALLFEMNGTFAWTPGPIAVLNVIPFLPLLLLGVEQSRKPDHATMGILWIAIAIAGSLYAGFPEEAYISGLLALAWAIYRFFADGRPWRFLGRVVTGGIIGLLLAAPIVLAFADYLIRSTALGSHQLGLASLPMQAFGTIVMPYIYGPSADSHGNSFISIIWGSTGGYLGLLLVLMAIYGLSGKRERGLRILLGMWTAVAVAKSFGIQPIMSLMNHVPMIIDAAFFRYSPPSWELAATLLVAFALEDIRTRSGSLKWPVGLSILILAAAIYTNWPWRVIGRWSPALLHTLEILFFLNLTATLFGLLVLVAMWTWLGGEKRRGVIAGLLLINAATFYMIPELSAVKPGRVDHKAVDFLKSHLVESRFFTTGPFIPNYSAYFGISSLNYNYLPIAANFDRYVGKYLFPDIKISSGVIFWPAWYQGGKNTVLDRIPAYEQVGVKYLVLPTGALPYLSLTLHTLTSGNIPLPLQPGQSMLDRFTVPDGTSTRAYGISRIGVFQGNYNNTANGLLSVHLCSESACTTGSGNLKKSPNNAFFYILLKHPLLVHSGEPLRMGIAHVGGTTPEALWLWPTFQDAPQNILSADASHLKNMGLRIHLILAGGPTLRKVYNDSLLSIYELPHPEPFYTFNGPVCTVQSESIDHLDVMCAHPATLLRRELYMPGWTARDQGKTLTIAPDQGIFQKIALTAGEHHLVFRFAPVHINLAWIAFFLGLFGLLIIVVLITMKHRRILLQSPAGSKSHA